jgi:cytidylate kinase
MISNSLADSLAGALIRATDYQRRSTSASDPQRPGVTITISREPGALGTAVAREVGQCLGWPVYDNELLNLISKEMGTQVDMLKLIDEKPVSFLEQAVTSLVHQYNLNQDSYMVHLIAVVRALAEHGKCLIVGRGATFLVPAARALRVRLTADPSDRIAAVQKLRGLSEKEAAKWVDKTYQDRRTFVKKYFGKDVTDPLNYDLVVNTSRWGVTESAGLIIDALQRLMAHQAHAGRKAE